MGTERRRSRSSRRRHGNSTKMTKLDIAAAKQALIDAEHAARNAAAVQRTAEARRRAVEASAALSAFIMEHDPPKRGGPASRAGQRQARERRANEGARRR